MRPSRLALAVAALVLWTGAAWRPRVEVPRDHRGDAELVALQVPTAAAHVRAHAAHDASPPPAWALAARPSDPPASRAVASIAPTRADVRPSLRIARSPRAPRAPPRSTTT
jgi:hypothetical protein